MNSEDLPRHSRTLFHPALVLVIKLLISTAALKVSDIPSRQRDLILPMCMRLFLFIYLIIN